MGKRIKYFKNKNQGIGKTRNFGIKKATGKYIIFLDSDDFLELNACEKMYEKAEKVEVPPKHKYAFVLGRDKRETNALRKEFLQRNKVLPYPKQRGFDNKDFAKRVEIRQNSTKEIIELTLF